jgi:hypothetical protein
MRPGSGLVLAVGLSVVAPLEAAPQATDGGVVVRYGPSH